MSDEKVRRKLAMFCSANAFQIRVWDYSLLITKKQGCSTYIPYHFSFGLQKSNFVDSIAIADGL